MDKAFVSLGRFMTSLINSKRASLHTNDIKPESSHDIFSLMLKASEGEGNLAMDDGELVSVYMRIARSVSFDASYPICQAGNTFLMLFAGHGWYNRLSQNWACDELELWQRRLDMPWLRLWDACLFTKISRTALFSKSKKLLGIIVTP